MSRTKKAVTCLLLAVPIMLVTCELAMAGAVPPPSLTCNYLVTFLPSLGTTIPTSTRAFDINDSGVIVGESAH